MNGLQRVTDCADGIGTEPSPASDPQFGNVSKRGVRETCLMTNPPAALSRTRKRLLLLVCGAPLGRHASRSLLAIVSLTTPILANPLDRARIWRNWETKPGRLLVESDLAPHPFSQETLKWQVRGVHVVLSAFQ